MQVSGGVTGSVGSHGPSGYSCSYPLSLYNYMTQTKNNRNLVYLLPNTCASISTTLFSQKPVQVVSGLQRF